MYRPENIPGFVFEEVTVTDPSTRRWTVRSGRSRAGCCRGAAHGRRHRGEDFAPGYGEFYTSGGGDTEALALAVPTDAVDEPVPGALTIVEARARDVLAAAGAGDWQSATGSLDALMSAWQASRPRVTGADRTRS